MPGRTTSRAGIDALSWSEGKASVLVRDLMAASTFETGEGFEALSPGVTVVLPTFRRGDNGMLRACIESVLAQTFSDFELIIVDDGSTDSTRRIIEEFLASDPRVATIRHPVNVGLPGLSCDEAILKARGEKLFFTFDDNTVEPDGLATMLAASESRPDVHFFYGEVFAPFPGEDKVHGRGEYSLSRLYEANFIANGAVLIDRFVFDRCGMYDPHILITRLCDWDLWLRIAPEFEPLHVEKIIATENGRTQPDSLGNSHTWDPAIIEEWLRINRNEKLRPDAILDYNVADAPEVLTELSQAKISAFIERFFVPPEERATANAGYILLICDDVTEDLRRRFIGNEERLRVVNVTHLQLELIGLWDLVLAARTIVFAGRIDSAEEIARALRIVEKRYDYYAADPDPLDVEPRSRRARALRDTVGRDFLLGLERIIRPEGPTRIQVAEIEQLDDLPQKPVVDLPELLRTIEWRAMSFSELFSSNVEPDTLEVIDMMNTLVRAYVPPGHFRPEELAWRAMREVVRRPHVVFRFARTGFKALRGIAN